MHVMDMGMYQLGCGNELEGNGQPSKTEVQGDNGKECKSIRQPT
jgi:hypothetical protein